MVQCKNRVIPVLANCSVAQFLMEEHCGSNDLLQCYSENIGMLWYNFDFILISKQVPPHTKILFSGVTSFFTELFSWLGAEISAYVCSHVLTK
jgi:hypothetical protein